MTRQYSKKYLIVMLLVFILLILPFIWYPKNNEHFANNDCVTLKTTEVYSANFIGNELLNTNIHNLESENIIGYGPDGAGEPNTWTNNEIVVDFGETKKITGLAVAGYGRVKIQFEIKDPATGNNKWVNAYQLENNNDIFEGKNCSGGFTHYATNPYNIVVNGSTNIHAGKVKFVKEPYSDVQSDDDKNTFKLQFQVYGLDTDAYVNIPSIASMDNLLENCKFNDGDAPPPTSDKYYLYDFSANNNTLKITFNASASSGIDKRQIYTIEMKADGDNYVQSYNVSYSSNSTETLHKTGIIGNIGKRTTAKHFFKYPLYANTLILKANPVAGKVAKCMIKVLGKTIDSVSDNNAIKADSENYQLLIDTSGNKKTCPPIKQMISRQAEIQQLCDAMEQTDEIAFEKKKIDTDRLYMVKLEKQSKEIRELEDKIKALKSSIHQFNQREDRNKMVRFKQQEEMDKKIKELVKKRLDKQANLNFHLSMKDIKNDDNKVDVEQFTNRLSKKFHKSHSQETLPPQTFYEEFINSRFFH